MTPRRSIIPIFIPHLGCPNDCVFCNQKRISGCMRPAEPRDVVSAIDEALARGAAGAEAAFYGGSFTAIPAEEQEALLGAAQSYLREGKISSLRLSTRPDAIDDMTLERLERFGVRTIELGAQSMCDDVLIKSGRGHTSADTVHAAGLIKRAGFSLILQMMTGLPGSDDERDVETAARIIALRPDGVRIYPTVVIRDTALHDMLLAGEYREHTVEDAVRVCARIVPMLEETGIPVIRLGLNPTDDLSGGDAVGGAYHPALGEMVRSRIMLQKARAALEGGDWRGQDVTLLCAGNCVSQLAGQHRCNKAALMREFGMRSIKIVPADLAPGEVRIQR